MKVSTLKKKLQELLDKEGYEVDDSFSDNVDKVLSGRAFQVENGYAKYLSPGQRTAKNIKQEEKYDKFDFQKAMLEIIKEVPIYMTYLTVRILTRRLRKSASERG